MDGQGNLNDQAIQSTLNLTNIVLLNFGCLEFNEVNSLKDLNTKIEMINKADEDIYIILVIRDASKSERIKKENLLTFVQD